LQLWQCSVVERYSDLPMILSELLPHRIRPNFQIWDFHRLPTNLREQFTDRGGNGFDIDDFSSLLEFEPDLHYSLGQWFASFNKSVPASLYLEGEISVVFSILRDRLQQLDNIIGWSWARSSATLGLGQRLGAGQGVVVCRSLNLRWIGLTCCLRQRRGLLIRDTTREYAQ